MTPRQREPPGRAADDDWTDDLGENAWPMLPPSPTPAAAATTVMTFGPLELMRFAVEQLNRLAAWVVSTLDLAAMSGDTYDEYLETRRIALENLVIMSHVGHLFLRHRDPNVRDVAELLTNGTASLIGRIYHSVTDQLR